MAVPDRIKNAVRELILPEFAEIKTMLQRLDYRMEAQEKRLESVEREMNARFDAVDQRLVSLQRDLDVTIDLHERIAAIEVKLGLGR